MWAINKIDHAPELPFARGVGSVRTRDKEPAQRIDGKKATREDEESREDEQAQRDKHMSSERATTRRCNGAIFLPKNTLDGSEGVSGRPVDTTQALN